MYRPRQTVYDLVTRDYYKIEAIRTLRMWGQPRTYLKLKGIVALRPEDCWRELYEISPGPPSKSIVALD